MVKRVDMGNGIIMWIHRGLLHIRTPDGKVTSLNREQAGKLGKHVREWEKGTGDKIDVDFRMFGHTVKPNE
jgi:hypothetical protein